MLVCKQSCLYPLPLQPPSLDQTRRRRAPSCLTLGAAYQKKVPRTHEKFSEPEKPRKSKEQVPESQVHDTLRVCGTAHLDENEDCLDIPWRNESTYSCVRCAYIANPPLNIAAGEYTKTASLDHLSFDYHPAPNVRLREVGLLSLGRHKRSSSMPHIPTKLSDEDENPWQLEYANHIASKNKSKKMRSADCDSHHPHSSSIIKRPPPCACVVPEQYI